MGVSRIKLFIYHHDFLAKLYNIYRNYRRDKYNGMSDEDFARMYYKQQTGKELNLENPATYNDKLWYLKLHVRDPLLTRCTDKLLVRDYVKECGLGHILNQLYGVYDDFEDIDFDTLPGPCILKYNHTSGTNTIYDRTKPFDYRYQKNEFQFWKKRNSYWSNREWNYKDIEPKIICERLLTQPGKDCLDDYKFMCFGGKVKLVFGEVGICNEDGSHNEDSKRNVYDRDFNLIEGARFSRENFDPALLPKPKNYEQMVEYAEKLSAPFIHCRVDLYNIDGEIYFGELTFYHQAGRSVIYPEKLDYEAGSWIDLTQIKEKQA